MNKELSNPHPAELALGELMQHLEMMRESLRRVVEIEEYRDSKGDASNTYSHRMAEVAIAALKVTSLMSLKATCQAAVAAIREVDTLRVAAMALLMALDEEQRNVLDADFVAQAKVESREALRRALVLSQTRKS